MSHVFTHVSRLRQSLLFRSSPFGASLPHVFRSPFSFSIFVSSASRHGVGTLGMTSRWSSLCFASAASRSPPLRGRVERWRTAAATRSSADEAAVEFLDALAAGFSADEAAVETFDALAAGSYVGTP